MESSQQKLRQETLLATAEFAEETGTGTGFAFQAPIDGVREAYLVLVATGPVAEALQDIIRSAQKLAEKAVA